MKLTIRQTNTLGWMFFAPSALATFFFCVWFTVSPQEIDQLLPWAGLVAILTTVGFTLLTRKGSNSISDVCSFLVQCLSTIFH